MMAMMSNQVSRPVLIALVVTALFGCVWFVALRPKSDEPTPAAATPATPATPAATPATSSGPNAPGVTGLSRDVAKAKATAAQQNAAANTADGRSAAPAATGGATASSGSPAAPASKPSATPAATTGHAKTPAATPAKSHHGHLTTPQRVQRALDAKKVLVFLFYNPHTPDDRAMRLELKQIKRHHGSVVVLSATVAHLAQYKAITAKVEVDGSPTLLFFDKKGNVAAVRGFADPHEINQRVLDVIKSGVRG